MLNKKDEIITAVPFRTIEDDEESNDKLKSWQIFVNIIKTNIGIGILGLPLAIKHAGIIVGTFILALMAIVSVHCMHLIIECNISICTKYKLKKCNFGDVAEYIFKETHPNIGKLSKWVTDFIIVVAQIGFCCVYILFICQTIIQYFQVKLALVGIIIGVLLFIVSLSKSLKLLSLFTTTANIIQMIAILIISIYLLIMPSKAKDTVFVGSLEEFPLFFGTAFFAFEGIAVILPLKNVAANPESFNKIVNYSMISVTTLYITFGVLGYVSFGGNLKATITLNLPNNWFFMIVNLSYAIAIFLSFNIQFYIPMEILDNYLQKHSFTMDTSIIIIQRIIFISLAVMIAVTIPQLDNIVSLIGSFAGSAMMLILPALFHSYFIYHNQIDIKILIKNVLIVIIGVLGSIIGCIISIKAIYSNLEF